MLILLLSVLSMLPMPAIVEGLIVQAHRCKMLFVKINQVAMIDPELFVLEMVANQLASELYPLLLAFQLLDAPSQLIGYL